jgi:hypothetical protein
MPEFRFDPPLTLKGNIVVPRFSLPFNPCLPRPAKQPPLRVPALLASGTHQTDRIKMIYAGL